MAALLLAGLANGLHAESGRDAWLRYARLTDEQLARANQAMPQVLVVFGSSPLVRSAETELIRGISGMTGRRMRTDVQLPTGDALLLGTAEAMHSGSARIDLPQGLGPDEFWIGWRDVGQAHELVVTGGDERAVLYGAFGLLRVISGGRGLGNLHQREKPYAPIRWVNQWDNLDGSIERGYGGRSIFWDAGHARADLTRVSEYGRLLASVGIDGCTIDNVNANPRMLASDFIPEIARIADAFRPWGVRVSISVDFGSPKSVGGLDTFDPVDPRVAAWWKAKADELYRAIPDLGGFVLKADSEGRVGPSTYGRTHADAANVVGRALAPHGGLLLYRGFVYNHHMDWRDPKNDRAKAAYDNFHPLDGQFDDNVVIQIKNGPIDFQVREPASPLFGGLEKTNEAAELQITQEYSGQGRYTVFLVPQWKAALDFDEEARGEGTPVKALAAGKVFHRPTGGFAGVANVGMDENWFGNELSQANLYGFGRLAWNPNLGAEAIVREWTAQTFQGNFGTLETIGRIQLNSWRAFEDYTGPLGLQTLTDIVGNHYGVAVEASERNGWGQWHRADEHGVGMDRTVATGTGFTGQYRPPVMRMFEELASCPDDLLLFFHHVPYTYQLHSGSTVIQTLYDLHYAGQEMAEQFVDEWESMRGAVDPQRFSEVETQLRFQADQARVWRDAVNDWFFKESGIPDDKGRVGNHPGRVEAESMELTGYKAVDATPWEAASGGKAVSCDAAPCTASFAYKGPADEHAYLRVEYFDQNRGVARFRVSVNGKSVDEWKAADHLPSGKIDGTTSVTRTIGPVDLAPGATIRVDGTPDGGDQAALDYVQVLPQPHAD